MDPMRGHIQSPRLCGRSGVAALVAALFLTVLPAVAFSAEFIQPQATAVSADCSSIPPLLVGPVYRIPLRVHLGVSGRDARAFLPILEEINDIWLSQAGICFEMQEVMDDRPAEQGMDIWFMPALPGGPGLNGYFRSNHNIQVRDTPDLSPAPHPARYPAARTAAHECGHGLSLMHRQDSDDNLMRSKTYGWQLNGEEVSEARNAAAAMALPDLRPRKCGEPRFLIPLSESGN